MSERILVVGAGAVGGYVAARLAQAGRDVVLLAREPRVAQLRARGLRLVTPDGVTHLDVSVLTPAELARDAAAGADRAADLVIVTVKSPGLDWAVRSIVPAVGAHTAILPLLNGMAQLDAVGAAFGPERVVGGLMRIVASLDGAGDIRLHQQISTLTFGEVGHNDSVTGADAVTGTDAGTRTDAGTGTDAATDTGTDTPRTARLQELLEVPGLEVIASADILGAMWAKWAFIAAAGALTCLARGPVGAIVATPGGTALVADVLAETLAVAAAAGHPLTEADVRYAHDYLTTSGSRFVPSLYRDVVAGRPGEGEHILGDLTRRARDLAIATPLCDLALLQLRVCTRGDS